MAKVSVGDQAPAFEALNQNEELIKSTDFIDKKIVLYFYPKDMTPGCTTEACDFQENLSRIKRKKVVVIGVSADSVQRHQRFAEKYDLKFNLLADEDLKICKSYGVYLRKKLYGKSYMGIVRSTFIIGEDGKIEHLFDKVKVKGHVDEVISLL